MAKAKATKDGANRKDARTKAARDRTVEFLRKAGLKSTEAEKFRNQWFLLPLDRDLITRARKFVSDHKGGWDHDSWVNFLGSLKSEGWDTGRSAFGEQLASRCLGILVESIQGQIKSPKKKSASAS